MNYLSRLTACMFLVMIATISSANAADGLISVKSAHDVKTTADRLESMLLAKGMTVFTRIDHAAGAKKAGLALSPTEVVVFGNPKVGTPLMNCAATTAIDLPQKALIHQDNDGHVWLSYNDPAWLSQRHSINECKEVLTKVSNALGNFAKGATSP